MLALAIGLSTAMFTVVDALLLRRVPFPEADRLTGLWVRGPNGGRSVVSRAVFNAWRDAGMFDALEAVSTHPFVIGEGESVIAREGAFVSPGLLPLLGAQPIAGRLFTDREGRAGSDDVVLISERLWRSRFAAARSAIGSPLLLDGRAVTIAGVLPASFRYPAWETEIWRPLDFMAPPPAEADRLPQPIGRVAPSVSIESAMERATAVAHQVERLPPDNWAEAEPLASPYRGQYAQAAAPLFAVCAGLVFLVLCANVSGLLLARVEERRREIGVTAALGASRARILRESMIESALLATAGLVAGVWLASALVALARAYLPESLVTHTLNVIDLDARALTAASIAAIAAVIVTGLLPAWMGTRVSPISVLRPATRGASEGRSARALRRGLLVVELGLACALLAGAAVLTRSFARLVTADRGIDVSDVTIASMSVGPRSSSVASRAAVSRAVEEAVLKLPGVEKVAMSYGAPPYGGGLSMGDWYSDREGAAPVTAVVYSLAVGPEYFDIYRIPLLRGRLFEAGDPQSAVVVGERFAALLWPDQDPVGRTFRFKADGNVNRVVGVVREATLPTTDPSRDRPEFYYPWEAGYSFVSLSVKCPGGCPDAAVMRDAIRRASPVASVARVIRLESEYARHVEGPRAAAALVLVFGGVAALAVAGGLFAMLAHAAGRRRREFGIRLALGARTASIRLLVLREGAFVAGFGILLGLATAWWFTRGLGALLYGVAPADPASWIASGGAVMLVSLAASWWPAARAAKADPARLLNDH